MKIKTYQSREEKVSLLKSVLFNAKCIVEMLENDLLHNSDPNYAKSGIKSSVYAMYQDLNSIEEK